MHRRAISGVLLLLGFAVALGAGNREQAAAQDEAPRCVHAPYFADEIRPPETAVFWFGRVTAYENYADVRTGYTDAELYLRIAIFDRRIWYDTTPSAADLDAWDAVTLYLDLEGEGGSTPDAGDYRFVAQFSRDGPRAGYQAAYQGDGSGWEAATVSFTTTSTYRGLGGPNRDEDNRGWVLWYHIPFASLGLSGPPPETAAWGMAVALHDRDDAADSMAIATKTWPEAANLDQPATWGRLSFGPPTYTPPPAVARGTVTVRHKLDGATVVDGAVGGGTTCGSGLDYWSEWGNANYAGQANANVQNQADIADWPCFSRYYVTFPLGAIPTGRIVLSATMTLHQFGNSGGGSWGEPNPSLIQVFSVSDDWNEQTLTWNNGPLAAENVSAAWVDALTSFPGWPGVPRVWDVSYAVAQAYAAGQPLRLALYSADMPYHSGKYFVTSDTGDWNAVARPTLTVTWGEPLATVRKEVRPVAPTQGQVATYTLALLGNGDPLTLTDDLPAQVSAPLAIQVTGGPAAQYDAGAHRLLWSGSPGVGQPVTITFPATVLVSGPQAVFNTAVLSDSVGLVSSDEAVLIVDARQIWLPLVLRDG